MNTKKVKQKKAALTADDISQAKKLLQLSDADVGSSGVQIVNLTQRILLLTQHMISHRGDKHSRHGLVKLVSQRRRLLKHLKNTDSDKHTTALASLGLRK